MKEKVTIRHAVSSHLRGIKELHKVSPKFFPLLTLHCFFSAIFPLYLGFLFSTDIDRTRNPAQSRHPMEMGNCRGLMCWRCIYLESLSATSL